MEERCETSHAARSGKCAVWLNADTLCDRPLGHAGDHVGHDPSGSGQSINVAREEDVMEDVGSKMNTLHEAMVGAGTAHNRAYLRRVLREHAPLVVNVIEAARTVDRRPDVVALENLRLTLKELARGPRPPEPRIVTEVVARCPRCPRQMVARTEEEARERYEEHWRETHGSPLGGGD